MPNVEMKTSAVRGTKILQPGRVYEVDEKTAERWITNRRAVATDRRTSELEELYARLEDGAGKPCLFLPFVGEFGHCILSHIRLVHFHQAKSKVVCCRPGEEVLFPDADVIVTDWIDPHDDGVRGGTMPIRQWPELQERFPDLHPVVAGGLSLAQAWHCVHPTKRIPFKPKTRGLRADVVLGIRNRRYDRPKNWKHWQEVADALIAAGYTVAVAGHRDTSEQINGQVAHSGDYDTAAAIELMKNCRLFIGTDTGVSHLAAEVQAPMLVFGLHTESRTDYRPRMQEVNPNVDLLNDAWNNPLLVIDRALSLLSSPPPAPAKAARPKRKRASKANPTETPAIAA